METRRLGHGDGSLLRSAVGRLLAGDDGAGTAASVDHLEGVLADTGCFLLVCVDGGDPIGYLSAFAFPEVDRDGRSAYLYDVVVRADHRRRGVATELVSVLKRLCRAEGVDTIWVGTSLTNAAARRTFESTGAVRVSETYTEYVYNLTSAE